MVVLGCLVACFVAVWVLRRRGRIAVLLVIAVFVTRPAIEIGGVNLRLEVFAALICLISLVKMAAARERMAMLRSSWLSISAVVLWLLSVFVATLLFAPDPTRSLATLTWCGLNVISAAWVAMNRPIWRTLVRAGAFAALACSFMAIIFYLLSSLGLSKFGVQIDPAYGGFAAYVFSIEANILAGLLCLWSLLALYNPMSALSPRIRVPLALIAPIAIITTHTRAALIAYGIGLVIFLASINGSRKLALGVLSLGGAASAVFLFNSNDSGLAKFTDLFDTSDGTGGQRSRVTAIALNEWGSSDGVLTGLGWNSFGQRHFDETQPTILPPGYLGNLPVQIIYDGGLLALIFVGIAVISGIVTFIKLGKTPLVAGLAVPYVVFSLATSSLWLLETWLFVGFVWGYARNEAGNGVDPIASNVASNLPTKKF